MDQIVPTMTRPETPTLQEHEAARLQPGGFIYRIDPGWDPAGRVPPEAIQGAWAVDANGRITGAFQANSRYAGQYADQYADMGEAGISH